MSSVLIADPINHGYSHVAFNATIIKAVAECERVDKIYLRLSEKLPILDSITKLDNNCSFGVKPRIDGSSFDRFFMLVKKFQNIHTTLKKTNSDTLILLAADNLVTPAYLWLLSRLLRPSKKLIVILHNNIDQCSNSKPRRMIWNLCLSRKVTPVVLADFVEKNFSKFFKDNQAWILKHPIYDHLPIVGSSKKPTRFFTNYLVLGRHSRAFSDKSLAATLIQALMTNVDENSLRIEKGIISSNAPSGVRIESYRRPLPDEEYWNYLHTSKFLIIPPESGERITASGVLADALSVGIPVIAPNKNVFKEFLPSSYPELLYQDEELAKAISYANSLGDNDYNALRQTLLKHAEQFSLSATSESIASLLSD